MFQSMLMIMTTKVDFQSKNLTTIWINIKNHLQSRRKLIMELMMISKIKLLGKKKIV